MFSMKWHFKQLGYLFKFANACKWALPNWDLSTFPGTALWDAVNGIYGIIKIAAASRNKILGLTYSLAD